MIKSMRVQNIEKMIDKVIGKDPENEEMNIILKMAYTGNVNEEVLKDIDRKREEDLKYIYERYQIVINSQNKICDTNINKDE